MNNLKKIVIIIDFNYRKFDIYNDISYNNQISSIFLYGFIQLAANCLQAIYNTTYFTIFIKL